MKKLQGVHFYVNVRNFNDVIIKEEENTGKVKHAIHALDTYFSSIESFGKKFFPNEFVVEKITGSRLHMYVLGDVKETYTIVTEVVGYASNLAIYLNNDIPKYKSLTRFDVQVGACFGNFYSFEFKRNNADEETSIGYAANYAAKLQGLCQNEHFVISASIFDALSSDEQNKYTKRDNSSIHKYGEICYYEAQIMKITGNLAHEEELKMCKEYANSINLTDMNFRSPNKMVRFNDLSKTEGKEISGIPLFADIRGFTSKFDSEDANLEQMTDLTQKILTMMYNQIEKNNGIHVQFQGDREFALFHNYGNYECYEDAVKAGLNLIDAVKEFEVSIGVGQSFGKMFAAKIGARGEKDFLLTGSTVIEADKNEDENAKENQLVISSDIYEALKVKKPNWICAFQKKEDYYYTSIGYEELLISIETEQLKENNRCNNYNGAWGKDIG